MIFERGYFNNYNVNESRVKDSLNEIRHFSAENIRSQARSSVFLSHKHDDLNDIKEVMGMHEGMGAKIYIDSMDNKMPNETSGETVTRIKDVIKVCNKFILLATDKAIESYWCNWELGIGDVHKCISNSIAILPMKEKDAWNSQYKGNEYLQIYPSISYNKAFTNVNGCLVLK